MAQQLSTNTFGVAKWVVSPDPTQGTHTTITAALASASSGDTIWVRDGTYNESFTAVDGVTLQASSSFSGFGVIINGTLTVGNQNFVMNGMFFNTTGASCVLFNGTTAVTGYFYGCWFQNTGADIIVNTNSNSGSMLNLYFCYAQGGGANAVYTHSGAGEIFMSYTRLSDLNTTVRSQISNGGWNFLHCTIDTLMGWSSSAGGGIVSHCEFQTATASPVVLVTDGQRGYFFSCYFLNYASVSATSVFTCNSPASFCLSMCSLNTVNASLPFLVNGNGAIRYSCVSCADSSGSFLIPIFNSTLSLTPCPVRLGNATNFASVAFSDSPYTVAEDDETILVDTSGGAVTLLFPDAPEVGLEWTVKDNTGNALLNNITLTTVSGIDMIDGATSSKILINYGSATLTATSSSTYIIT